MEVIHNDGRGHAFAVLNDPAPVLDLAHQDARARLYRPISEKIRAGG